MIATVENSWFVAADIETLGLGNQAPIVEFGVCVSQTGVRENRLRTTWWTSDTDFTRT